MHDGRRQAASPRARREGSDASPFPQDLLRRLALGQFVDQLVQIADLPHERILDLLHLDAADHALDQGARRFMRGAWAKKVSKSVRSCSRAASCSGL